MGVPSSSSSGTTDLSRRTDDDPEVLDDLARRTISLALKAPTDHLSDVTSWHAHVPFAYALVSLHRPRLLVELGVHKGDSYLTFCRALADHGVEGKAVGIDSWKGDAQAGPYDGDAILESLRKRHDPDFAGISTLLRKTFDEALADIEDGSVDLLHIDGRQSYDEVKHDFEAWLPKLSQRGIVLVHDIKVTRGNFGVWKLWQEVSRDRECYEFPYGNGLGVLALGQEIGRNTSDLLGILRNDYGLSGLPIRDLLARVGGFLESKGRADLLLAEIGRINREHLDERARWRVSAIHGGRETQAIAPRALRRLSGWMRTGRDRLKALRIGDFAHAQKHAQKGVPSTSAPSGNAEIKRLKRQWDRERKALKVELARLQEELNKPTHPPKGVPLETMKGKARVLLAQSRHAARISGRNVIARLPISQDSKVRLKYAILSVAGPLFGLRRGNRPPPPSTPIGDRLLNLAGNDYLTLAASARGPATNIPNRSVSIIVPVYNQLDYTLSCLEAIQANTTEIDYEVIVVDDGSTDATRDTLSKRTDILYRRNKTNLGFIGSCNAGAACAKHNYLCFLNNDTKVLPGWLAALVDTFELHENVGLAGSKLVYPDGRLQEAGGLIWNDGSGWNWGRLQDPNAPIYNYSRNADYCSGASILVPRAVFSALGGFDPHYSPAYGEDSDLCFKIRSLGLATIYQPLSQVVHFEGVTSGTDTSQGVKKHQIVNAQKLAARWKPALAHQGQPGVDAVFASDRGTVGRVLVLDQITPEPDRDAGSITALEIMRALRDLGYKVAFAPCSNLCRISPYTDVLSALGIESILLPWAGSLERHLQERGSTYDAVLIFRPNTWRDHIGLLRKYAPQAKLIYHTSDLHFVRESRAQTVGRGNEREASRSDELATEELNVISTSDLCIVHSTVERDLVKDLRPHCRVVCFPWIYEARGTGKSFDERAGVIFVGGYRHPPNVDAVEHYLKSIHPLAKENLPPGTKFIAAGSNPPPSLQDLAGPDVEITGYVEDISQPLFNARVMVVPLRYGAGIKGKILSAMAHGLPVVTSTVGAEGMGLVDGEDLLIADEPSEFAAAVQRLYESPELWRKLQRAGLDYIDRTTSRRVGLKIVASILEQLDLTFVGRDVPVNAADDGAMAAPIGSRLELSSVVRLAQAGQRSHPAFAKVVDLLVLPDNAPAADSLPAAIAATATHAELQTCPANAKNILVVADATDTASLKALSRQMRKYLPANASCVVVLAPPRLEGTASGYRMLAPFSPGEVSEVNAPFHEKFADLFDLPGRASKWCVDKSLTGFPSVTMVQISSAGNAS